MEMHEIDCLLAWKLETIRPTIFFNECDSFLLSTVTVLDLLMT